ncbi:MAG TPA: LptF/LptG family permease [Vicinamibacterales bacterium]|nr:LptF/LptG family permease [Vicinamibacterales bacterium]
MGTLDRYVIRQVIPPFLLALVIFTFILEIPPIMEHAERLIAKGVPWPTVGRILLTLLPSGLGIAIPVALLVGLLVGLGRLSSDRETVAMLACGVSLYRLLRPVVILSTAAFVATLWVLIYAIPDANQTFREITYDIIAAKAEHDVRPRVFFEEFPGRVLFVQEEASAGWRKVFLADTSDARPVIFLAERGRLVLDRAARRVDLVLADGIRYSPGKSPGEYDLYAFRKDPLILGLDPNTVFPAAGPPKGISELTIPELQAQRLLKESQGLSPHNEIMFIQQKFSIPAACLVFGLLGLALGVTARRDGRLAGFAIGLGVVFVYYIVMYLAEGLTKGHLMPAVLARWMPNLVLAPVAVGALIWRARWAEGRFPIPSIRLPRFARWRRTESPAPASRSATPVAGGGDRIVLVVRFPRFWYPRLTVLDRYISTLAIRIMALAFAGLLGLFYIATFVDLSDKLFKGQATPGMLLEYFWYASPQFIYFVIPLSILVASLVVVGILARTSELTVMKACGISLYRAAAPLLLVAMVASATLFLLEENLLARANRRAEALNDEIRGRAPRTFNLLTRRWLAGREGALYHYAFFDAERDELSQLSVYEFAPDAWRLARHTFTGRASYRPRQGGWVGQDGWVATFPRADAPPTWERFEKRLIAIEPPEHFETERPDERFMTASELRTFVSELRASGLNAVPMEVALARKIAFPFVTVVMTLIAIPFAATTGRSGAVYGIGLGIALAIGYWMLMSAFGAVGSAGLLPPMLAAWGPNLLFGGGAAYLLLVVRT